MTAFTQDINYTAIELESGAGRAAFDSKSAQLAGLIQSCSTALTGESSGLVDALAGMGSADTFADLVDSTRLWSACETAFAIADVKPPAALTAYARAARGRSMLVNTRAMGLARLAFPCLAQHKIAAIAFKGPFHQRQIYDDWFARRSNDLDLLVPRDRFEDALAALGSIGFQTRSETSQWWKLSLGEVHLDYPGGGVIDLHHRLQQPGCPAPRDLPDFIGTAEFQQVGEAKIPIPSLQHALLISALNFCKELFHRKPSARYAFDFSAGALRLAPGDHEAFAALVQRQGLEGPVGFTIAACENLFGPLPGLPKLTARRSGAVQWTDDIDLARLVFTPESKGLRWPRRRALLWQFCGGEASARCSFDFAAQAGRIAVGEVLRNTAPEARDKTPT